MPDLTLLPNGMYRVTDETGGQYDMEAGFAQQQYPEKFETDFTAANEAKQSFEQYAAENYGGEPVMEQPAEDPALVDALAADLLAQESEIVMEPDVLGQPMVPAEAAPQPVAPQAAPQSQSRSMSYSESGTNPFEVRRSRGFSEAPDFTPEVMAMRDAAQQQQAALGQEQQATEEFQQRSEQAYGDIQAERQYQAQRAQEMHDNAMQAVAEQEARLAHRMENMTKMDMNKIWKDTPQGARVAGMFSAAIAGWLNPTGKNSVIEQMMQMVDQSAREQAANMDLERFQVQGEQAAIGRFENRAARDRQVFMENRALVLASLQDGLQMERDKYQSAITVSRIDAQIAQVQNEFAKTVQGLKQRAFQNSFARDQAVERRRQDDANRAQRAAQFRKSFALKQAEAAAKARAGQNAGMPGMILNPLTNQVVQGQYKDPGDKVGMRDFQGRLVARAQMTTRMRDLMDRMADAGAIYGGFGSKFVQSEEAQALRGEYEDLRASYIKAMSGAQASDGEVNRLEKALPPPEGFLTRDPTKSINGFLDRQAQDQHLDNNTYLLGNQWDVKNEWGRPVQEEPRVFIGKEVKKVSQVLRSDADMADKQEAVYGVLAAANDRDLPPNSEYIRSALDALYSMSGEERSYLQRIDEQGNVLDPVQELESILSEGTGNYVKRERGKSIEEAMQGRADSLNPYANYGRE